VFQDEFFQHLDEEGPSVDEQEDFTAKEHTKELFR